MSHREMKYDLAVYFWPGEATTNWAIQVYKVYDDNSTFILGNYDYYNCLDTAYLIGDTSVRLVIRDTISFIGKQTSAVTINVNHTTPGTRVNPF